MQLGDTANGICYWHSVTGEPSKRRGIKMTFGRYQSATDANLANWHPDQWLQNQYGADIHFLGRTNLGSYGVAVDPSYCVPPHVDIMLQVAERVEAGRMDRVLVSMPPRHSKSESWTIKFPGWFLGRNPEKKVMIITHTQSLADRMGGKVRDLINDPMHQAMFPECVLSKTTKGKHAFETTAGGEFFACGVDGGATGRGADLLIIDDPIATAVDAYSKVMRQRVIEFYRSVAYTRLQPGGRIVIIMCMTGDTPVTMANGTYKPLCEIKKGDMVLAWKDGAVVPRKVLNIKSQGTDDVFEIKTGHAKVKANARHPFLVDRPGGKEWIRLANLNKGDNLVISSRIHGSADSDRITKEQAWMLGYMFGDGWITVRNGKNKDKKTGKLSPRRGYVTCLALCENEEWNELLIDRFEHLFGMRPKRTNYGYVRTEQQAIGKWFVEHGFSGNAKTKRIPDWLHGQSEAIRESFVQGVMDSDGHVVAGGRNKDRRNIGFSNEGLLRDIRHLARGIGYRTTNVHVQNGVSQPPNSPKPVEWTTYSCEWMPDSVETDFRTTAIRSIKPAGREEVWDIEVEDAHCFLADGLVSKNTRWHEGDLIGWLLDTEEQEQVEDWNILSFPAIAERDEGWRKEGEPLWPEKFPIESLQKIRRAKGDWDWASQYQQRPSEVEGRLIKRDWFKNYAWAPSMAADRTIAKAFTKPFQIFQSWDTAFEEDQTSDYSVCTTWLSTDSGEFLLDVLRKKMIAPELFKCAEELAFYWKPHAILVEKKASGHSLIQNIAVKTKLPVIPCDPQGNKFIRAQAVSPYIQAGRVFVPHQAPWLKDWINELVAFPTAAHDDQVDSTSQYLNWVTQMHDERRKWESACAVNGEVNPYDR